MRTVCPTCKEPKDVPDAYKGHEVKCESCKTLFIATPQPLIIERNPQSQPKIAQELLGLPSSKFPKTMGNLCIGISVLSLTMVVFAVFVAFGSSDYIGVDEGMDTAGKAIVVAFCSLLIAALLYGIASIIDAINANTMRKK